MIAAIAASLVAGVLDMLMYRRLRHIHYSMKAAVTIIALATAQFGTALMGRPLPALLLALSLYIICTCASDFVQQRSVRNLIAFGGSLGFVQIFNPLGLLVAACLMPAVISIPAQPAPRSHGAALLVLLLFMPLSSAVALAYIASPLHIDMPMLRGISVLHVSSFVSYNMDMQKFICAVWLIGIGLPIWVSAIWQPRAVPVSAIVAGTVAIVIFASGHWLHVHSFADAAPAFAAMSVAALCEKTYTFARSYCSAFLSGFAALFAWLGVAVIA